MKGFINYGIENMIPRLLINTLHTCQHIHTHTQTHTNARINSLKYYLRGNCFYWLGVLRFVDLHPKLPKINSVDYCWKVRRLEVFIT